MIHSIDFYNGALTAHRETVTARIDSILASLMADMRELAEENQAHKANTLGLEIADATAIRDFENVKYGGSIAKQIDYMDKESRNWIMQRPLLQKELGLRVTTKSGKLWLEEDPAAKQEPEDAGDALTPTQTTSDTDEAPF